jgi:hypothetical protein
MFSLLGDDVVGSTHHQDHEITAVGRPRSARPIVRESLAL